MFRSVRFCYSFANKCRKLNGNSQRNVLNARRYSSINATRFPASKSPFDNDIDGDDMRGFFSFTEKYCIKRLTSDRADVNWDEFLDNPDVPKESCVNIYALIIITCQKQKLHQCAISFFLYLLEKNELTAGLLHLFCDLMLTEPKAYKCCEGLIYQIFKNLDDFDKTSSKACARVLLESPDFSDFVYGHFKENMPNEKYHNDMVVSLIKGNKVNQALELYVHNNVKFYWIEKLFLDYYLKETLKGKQTGDDVTNFIKEASKVESHMKLPDENIETYQYLFKELNALDKDYTWSVNTGTLISNSCPFCNWELKRTNVTEQEIKQLLKSMEDEVIFQDNIYMKSNYEEWTKFCDFIANKNYNLVMDGLNCKFFFKDYVKFKRLMNSITSLGLTPLILGRAHFTKTKEFKLINNSFPVFLTENLSDDDVFVLYAALKKGKGCYTLSNDKMRFCNNLLNKQDTDIFQRWQITHQCKLSHKKVIMLPSGVRIGSYKLGVCEDGELIYHSTGVVDTSDISVVCLRKIRKQHDMSSKGEIDPRENCSRRKNKI